MVRAISVKVRLRLSKARDRVSAWAHRYAWH